VLQTQVGARSGIVAEADDAALLVGVAAVVDRSGMTAGDTQGASSLELEAHERRLALLVIVAAFSAKATNVDTRDLGSTNAGYIAQVARQSGYRRVDWVYRPGSSGSAGYHRRYLASLLTCSASIASPYS
jgi:hypothetical protein